MLKVANNKVNNIKYKNPNLINCHNVYSVGTILKVMQNMVPNTRGAVKHKTFCRNLFILFELMIVFRYES